MPLRAVQRGRQQRQPREGFRVAGHVLRPHGVRGEVKVRPHTDFPQRFDVGARLYVDGVARTVAAARWHGADVLVRFDGIDDRSGADTLRDALLEVPATDRAHLGPDEYYLDEIEGCAVVDLAGVPIGHVREVLQPGANDVYIVARPGRADLLLPAIGHVICEVRIADRTIVVDIPPGLDPDERPRGSAKRRPGAPVD